MKRFVLLFGALLLAGSALAQSIGFGVHGNMFNSSFNEKLKKLVDVPNTAPTQQAQVAIDKAYGLGFGGGVHLDLGLGILKIRVSGDYLTLSPDKDKVKEFFAPLPVTVTGGGKVDMISGSANLKLTIIPLPVIKPYITAGGGVTHVSMTDVEVSLGSAKFVLKDLIKTQTVGAFNAGVGTDIDLHALTLFAELRVNWIMLEEGSSAYVPLFTAGITF